MSEELNKKLAEWAGFLPRICDACNHMRQPGEYNPCLPLPDFTQSLDACAEWLVPKLFAYNLHTVWTSCDDVTSETRAEAHKDSNNSFVGEDNNPALALCLAIEKLIDTEKQNGG